MKKIRVLVVDDSVLFRNLLVQSLSEDPYLEVVAQAGDAYAARDAIIKYRHDVGCGNAKDERDRVFEETDAAVSAAGCGNQRPGRESI